MVLVQGELRMEERFRELYGKWVVLGVDGILQCVVLKSWQYCGQYFENYFLRIVGLIVFIEKFSTFR